MLGYWNVDELLNQMTCTQLAEWMAFVSLQEAGKLQQQMEHDASVGGKAYSRRR